MRVGEPAYVALVDRMAAALRDQVDAACSKRLRNSLILHARWADELLTHLLTLDDPLLAVELYRDHCHTFLQAIE